MGFRNWKFVYLLRYLRFLVDFKEYLLDELEAVSYNLLVMFACRYIMNLY